MFCAYDPSSTDDVCCERKKKQCVLPLYCECSPVALWRNGAPADGKPSWWSCCQTLSSREVLLDDVASMNIRQWEIYFIDFDLLIDPDSYDLKFFDMKNLLRLEYTRQALFFSILNRFYNAYRFHLSAISQQKGACFLYKFDVFGSIWKYGSSIWSSVGVVSVWWPTFPCKQRKKIDKCMMPSVFKSVQFVTCIPAFSWQVIVLWSFFVKLSITLMTPYPLSGGWLLFHI